MHFDDQCIARTRNKRKTWWAVVTLSIQKWQITSLFLDIFKSCRGQIIVRETFRQLVIRRRHLPSHTCDNLWRLLENYFITSALKLGLVDINLFSYSSKTIHHTFSYSSKTSSSSLKWASSLAMHCRASPTSAVEESYNLSDREE